MRTLRSHTPPPLRKLHNGIPLGAHFIYLNFDAILAWWWLYLAETCRRTLKWYCHFMIRIVVFVDWPIYYCIDITQRDGSYQKKCVCSLCYPTCNAQAPYCNLWPVRLHSSIAHYLINCTILEKKNLWTQNVRLDVLYNILRNIS
jgi:hypothetical protein